MNAIYTIFLTSFLLLQFSNIELVKAKQEETGLDIAYEKFKLPNGLTTIVYSDHSAPKVFVGVWYRVGSKDEPKGKSGFAHLFEHLMFQETANRKGEYFDPFTEAGAIGMNGSTTTDYTNYFATVPTGALDMALWMESDRMQHLLGAIDKKAIDSQREVVKNEKRQGQLRPGNKVSEAMLARFYPENHPYAHSPIGSIEDLEAASVEDVKEWYKKYYGASNAILILAGDIDAKSAREKVAHYFSDVRPGSRSTKTEQWIPEINEIRKEIVYEDTPTRSFARNWPLPNNDSPDTVLLSLIASSLAGQKDSPLYLALVENDGPAYGVTASVRTNEINSVFNLGVSLKPDASYEEVNKIIDEELEKFFKKGPNSDFLRDVKNYQYIADIHTLENSAAIGRMLVTGELFHDDPAFFKTRRKWFNQSSPSQLAKLAEKWLSRPYLEITVLPNERLVNMTPTVDRSVIPSVKPTISEIKFPEMAQTTLENGIKIVVAERDSIPLVNVALNFETGSSIEKEYPEGTSSFAFSLLSKGTKKFNELELQQTVRKIGTGVSANGSQYSSNVGFKAVKSTLEDTMKLAAHMIQQPSYPQKEIDEIIDRVDINFDSYERDPMRSSGVVFNRAIWGEDHLFGKVPTREKSKTISRDAIFDFHENEIGPDNMTAYFVGDITLDEARKLIEENFSDWRSVSPSKIFVSPSIPRKKSKIILVDKPGSPQSSITAGHVIDEPIQENLIAEGFLVRVLGGGFGNRLNLNLREDKGWAYGFGASISNYGKLERIFRMSGSVQTDKTADSMAEIMKEITQLLGDKPITPKELATVKNESLQSIPMQFSNNGAFLSSIANSLYKDLPYDEDKNLLKKIQSVDLPKVQSLAKDIIKPDELIWVIIGDVSKIEPKIRALEIADIEIQDIYGNKIR